MVANSNQQEPKEVGDAPRAINPTPEELKASAYDTPNIEAAMVALHQDGFVVLKNVVDVAHVDHINSYMTGEADGIIKNNAKPFNQGVKCLFDTPYFGIFLNSVSKYTPRSAFERP